MSNPQFPPMPAPGVPDPARKKRAALYGVLAGIAVIAAVLIGLNAAGLLQLNAKPSPAGNLKAQGSQGPTLLEAQGNQPPSALEAKAPPKTDMPQNIKDWLEHLRKCENLKNDINGDQINVLSSILGRLNGAGGLTVADVDRISDPDGTMANLDIFRELGDKTSKISGKWRDLETFFLSKPAPDNDCQRIADSFDQGLREVAAWSDNVKDIFVSQSSSGELTVDQQADANASLMKIFKGHSKTTDDAFKDAKTKLAEIFRKYDTKQYFDIDPNPGSDSPLLKMMK